MRTTIQGAPAFAHLHVELEPGETLVAEADAMASMDADVELTTKLNGGFFSALVKRFLGGESLFVNVFANRTNKPRRLVLTQNSPGDLRAVELSGGAICLQPGAYVCSTPGLTLGVQWAGLASLLAREGLFKLRVEGTGTLWYGAYGCLVEKVVAGAYVVDTGHLVSYPPGMKLKTQLAGGLISSLLGGEGLVTRVEGNGTIMLQTRSISGLAGWLNPRI